MLVGAEVGGAALGAGFAVDVRVDVFLQVADDGGSQPGQGTGVDAAVVGRAGGLESQPGAQQRRRQRAGIRADPQARWVNEQRISVDQLRRIGIREAVPAAPEHIREVFHVGIRAPLVVGRVVARGSHGDVVDEVAVVRVVRYERAGVAERSVEVVLVAGVVDDPEVSDDKGLDAAAAVAVDDVVDDQRRWCIRSAVVIGAVAEVEDDAVAVGVIGGAVVFAGDDVVGDDVVEA